MIVITMKIIREEKGYTLDQIHKGTGISISHLSDLENNKIENTSIYSLYTISKFLDVNIKDFFYTVEEINSLKKSLNYHIESYGLTHPKTLKISRIIDLIIFKLSEYK